MGVTSLWDVVKPVARPVKLETLNRKRLAVDASIWIYQFLKAVRDKEGNALRNSHVVGFFRRICKLLFFGIKPVFVFDGGAPILKRQTISHRKARREGRREDMVRTAGKLLAKQMQHRAEEDQRKRREARERPLVQEEELPEELVYVEEQLMTPEQKKQNRQFKKKDAYHLPELDVNLNEMGQPNDPRIMSQAELEEYARHFHEGEDINLYDFSKIDFDGAFFTSLPATDRYNILNAARLRSRLRMGYSKEQLDVMFPNRMDFSRFQIERVRERNDLTQRLMNLNGMNPDAIGSGRVAGEKGKEYVLVQNEGVEGGWALGVVSNKDEGKREKPIDIDKPVLPAPVYDDSDDSFEDVPIEGLNRLPKRPKYQARPEADPSYADNPQLQEALFNDSLQNGASQRDAAADEEDTLFMPTDEILDEDDELFEDVSMTNGGDEAEDEELQRAIALSLQEGSDDEEVEETQRAAAASRAERLRNETAANFSAKHRASGRNFANYANARAAKSAPRPQGADAGANPELRAAFEAGRKMGQKKKEYPLPDPSPAETPSALVEPGKFKGLLPFESIDLGKSLFTKKPKPAEPEEGGFEKDKGKENRPRTPPPWFSSGYDTREDYERGFLKPRIDETDDVGTALGSAPVLGRHKTDEVIDLDAVPESKEPVDLLSSDEDDEPEPLKTRPIDSEIRMDDVADLARVEPPVTEIAQGVHSFTKPQEESEAIFHDVPVDDLQDTRSEQGEALEWEDSDHEDSAEYRKLANPGSLVPTGGEIQETGSETQGPEPEFENVPNPQFPKEDSSPDSDFEDVEMPGQEQPIENDRSPSIAASAGPKEDMTTVQDGTVDEAPPIDDEEFDNYFSDPEDEDLIKQLADEAEEHARFAAQLNVATGLQSAADYEKELKQLRNQQKAERRDADEVTQVMITECQQLLRLFGLPYITAPMEAEAQCAELHKLGLVDGIVTDDSDIFLFGGTRVYKNMFNQAKEVQCYIASDLEKEYGLDREKIIQIAQLLGSDYTEGIPNVGPVTALEILTEFGTLDAFQSWWTDVQTGVAPPEPNGFKKKFRKNATKIFLPPGFPDPRVDAAYLKPEVDNDPSEFQWGIPDLDALRQYLMATIGWSQDRTDEILVPVVRDINRRETEGTQANITRFFGTGGAAGPAVGGTDAYAPRRRAEGKSSRMENALGKLHERARRAAGGAVEEELGNEGEVEVEEPIKAPAKKQKVPARKGRKAKRTAAVASDGQEEDGDETDIDEYQPEPAPKGNKRKRKVQNK